MIHIDDLVRQRLDGGQEPDRPGAWLNMRNLLDKEMPVATGNNRRRIIGYLTGLLLLTTAGVGGYKLYDNRRNADAGSAGGGNGAEPVAVRHIESVSTKNIATNNSNGEEGVRTINRSGAQKSNTPAHSAIASRIDDTHSTSSSAQPVAHRTSGQLNRQPGTTAVRPSHQGSNPSIAGVASRHGKPANNTAAALVTNESVDPSASIMPDPAIGTATTPQAIVPLSSDRYVASAAGTTYRGRRAGSKTTQLGTNTSDRLIPAASVSVSPKQIANPLPAPVKFRHDTVQAIELVARRFYDAATQKTLFRVDTFLKGNMVVARYVPQPEVATTDEAVKPKKHRLSFRRQSAARDKESVAAIASTGKDAAAKQSQTVLPAAKPVPGAKSDAVAKADASKNESLEAHKVSGKTFSLWNAEHFNEAINKFKFNLAKIQMYPGLIGGINGSFFTPNSLGGFQVGLTSLFVLNDWWSLMTELKYLYRFNTGSTVRDDYMNVVPGSGSVNFVTIDNTTYKAYEWKDEHVDHYFNYEVVKTLELPVALRYSWGRTYAQGGVNFVYSMKVAAAEVTNYRADVTSHRDLRPASHDDEPFIMNNAPLVKISDFGARFGTGYVLGGGFMFTPAVYMDFRVSQTFWDNANTGGAKQISKDLLRTPSIQLSVGYRFSQHKP